MKASAGNARKADMIKFESIGIPLLLCAKRGSTRRLLPFLFNLPVGCMSTKPGREITLPTRCFPDPMQRALMKGTQVSDETEVTRVRGTGWKSVYKTLRNDTDLKLIAKREKAFAAAVRTGSHLAMSEANKEFHMAIAYAGKNRYLATFYDKLLSQGQRMLHLHSEYLERTHEGIFSRTSIV